MPTNYDKGDLLRISGAFTDDNGDAVDPTTVTFKAKYTGGTTTYIYGTDAELVKDSVGNYHVDWTLDTKGEWWFRVESTGTGQAADELAVNVVTAF